MSRDLVIVGASGHGREVAACLLDGDARATVRGYIDDDSARWGTSIGPLPVLGGIDLLRDEECDGALGVGYPEVKHRVLRRVGAHIVEWPTIVARSATIGPRVELAAGAFLQNGCILTTDIDVGEFATVNIAATISHDCRIGRLATISPGAHLGGAVTVGEGAFVGIGASVVQGVTLGAWSVVGAGAVVTRDVPENAVAVGVPARIIKLRKPDWQHD